MKKDAAWYESAYNPRVAVPEFNDHFERWKKRSQEAQQALAGRAYTDVAYGPDPMQKLDIYRAKGESQALLVYIHGGYWRALDKNIQTFIAPPYVERGVTVASINYSLCPTVYVQDIVLQVLQACAWLYRNGQNFGAPRNRLFVSGHSAGGHLVTRLATTTSPLPERVRARVKNIVPISPLVDLRPLMRTGMNRNLRIDVEEARRESPALLEPLPNIRLSAWVGALERPELIRQTDLIANIWRGLGVHTSVRHEVGRHHYDVIEGLKDPNDPLTLALCED